MAWIESHQSLLKHRKTMRMVVLLAVDRFKLIGHLHALWWWALDNVPMDGDLGDLTDEEIAMGAEWDGDAAAFAAALTAAGFINVREDTRVLHDWYDYAGKLLGKRQRDRERKHPPEPSADIARSSDGIPSDVARNSDGIPTEVAGTVPNRTVPNRTNQDPGKDPGALAEELPTGPNDLPPDDTGVAASAPREDKAPDKGPRAASQEAKALAIGLHTALEERGVTVFEPKWQAKSQAVAERLIRQLGDARQVEALIAWALQHPFWGTKIRNMAKIADLAAEWQQRALAETGPPVRAAPSGTSQFDRNQALLHRLMAQEAGGGRT